MISDKRKRNNKTDVSPERENFGRNPAPVSEERSNVPNNISGSAADVPRAERHLKKQKSVSSADKENRAATVKTSALHDGDGKDGSLSPEAAREIDKSAADEGKLSVIGFIWSVIGTVYIIVSTVIMLVRKWVINDSAYVLIGCLAVYVVIFIMIVALNLKNKQRGVRHLSVYKPLISLFKIFANLMFLVVSVVQMTGLAGSAMSFRQWLVFILTFVVVLVQFIIKTAQLATKLNRRRIGKKYNVNVGTYVDGEKKKQTHREKRKEKSYK